MKNNILIYICHFLNKESINRFNTIKNALDKDDFDILYVSPTPLEYIKNENLDEELFLSLNIELNIFKNECYKDLPKNELCYCDIYNKFPNYKNYWFIEYDVIFNNNISENWKIFFDTYKHDNIDLLCCHYNKYDKIYKLIYNKNIILNQLKYNKSSDYIIDNLIIGEDLLIKENDLYFSFLPCCMVSNNLLRYINEYYMINFKGTCAFFEYVIPTIANKYNMKIVDFDNKYSNINKNTIPNKYKKNIHYYINYGSVSWYTDNDKQIRYSLNTLLHPVKIKF